MAQKTLRISLSPSIISLLLFHSVTVILSFSCFALSKLPAWMKAFVPRLFYVTEKAWNFYPYTITGVAITSLHNAAYLHTASDI